MHSTNWLRFNSIIAILALFPTSHSLGQVIFTEAFDDASSALRFQTTDLGTGGGSGDTSTALQGTVYLEFGFDYSATGSSRLTQSILTATTGMPANGGSAKGLLLAANQGHVANRSSVNLFPIILGMGLPTDSTTGLPVISSNYKMTFDFFAAVNGTGDLQSGAQGSIEFLQIGAQSNGDGRHLNGFSAATPDSDFFELNILGDFSRSDLIAFSTRGGSSTLDQEFIPNTNPQMQQAFPGPQSVPSGNFLGEDRWSDPGNETGNPDGIPDGGAPVERWSTAEIRHEDGITTITFNGVDITTIEYSDFSNDLENPNGPQAGLPWFGYADFFSSIAGGDSPLVADGTSSFDPFNASFAIIDNVVVTVVPEPTAIALLGVGLLAAVAITRQR